MEYITPTHGKMPHHSTKKMQMSQIPDSILHQLSTDQLVALCAKHPLDVICNAYDDPMIGAKYIVQDREQHRYFG